MSDHCELHGPFTGFCLGCREDAGYRRGLAEGRAEAEGARKQIASLQAEVATMKRGLGEIISLAGDIAYSFGGSHDEQRAAIFNAASHVRDGRSIEADDYRTKKDGYLHSEAALYEQHVLANDPEVP